MKLFVMCLPLMCSLLLAVQVKAEDVLDVETEMEDAFQDSEAAVLESKDAKVRQTEQAESLAAAEAKAKAAIEKAKAKEVDAKNSISASDLEIQKLKKKTEVAEAERVKSEKHYNELVDKITKKREEVSRYQLQVDAKEKFLSEQKAKTAAATEEARKKEEELTALKDRMAKASQDFQKAKKDDLAVQARLNKANSKLQQQQAAGKDQVNGKALSAHESYLQQLRGGTKAAAARVPTSINQGRTLNLKSNCKAYLNPEASGAPVWTGNKGQSVSASAYNQTWARLNLAGGKTAYMAKSCF